MTYPENEDSLVEFFPELFAKFSVNDPEKLTSTDVNRIKSGHWDLKDLVESPAWDEDEMLLNIEELLETQIHERITDQATSPVYAVLQILRHDDNSWIDENIRERVHDSYAPFHGIERSSKISNPLELRFLATYAPINWSETSEFGSIDRTIQADDRSAVSMFVDTSEEDVDDISEQYFRPAYPELY